MTPEARVAAAIEVLDAILKGAPAERVLTNWARGNRFAGSGDRAAIRDHVYDALRRRRSLAAWGGSETGRGLMLGHVRATGLDPAQVFDGARHAPPPLDAEEAPAPHGPWPRETELDCPDWLLPRLDEALGHLAEPVLRAMQSRAPVHLRVNLRKADQDEALRAVAAEGIVAQPHDLSPTALEVLEGARRIRNSRSYGEGLVEVQDAASQAVADAVPVKPGARVLDLCAGGGGKTLALAARQDAEWHAHDAFPRRMADLPERARRAGVVVALHDRPPVRDVFDVVLVDAPCSGSGTWRRDPAAKWSLTPRRLSELRRTQTEILDQAAELTAADGTLAYVTCSLLREEDEEQIAGFLERHSDWSQQEAQRLTPLDGGDGFFLSIMRRELK
ncbi:RsmB/NOP family class I SAM-dependent RNA methyltransferase [Roseitranquillus sediminis]|uniref:RsmB/NOP family class I SAM-dependent RNA methyltransferase n=1 Tax=Roseitranquillus sediminis TaxID=2809051 RepID=UPI001D0C083A|nr:RsmB/NOP family class I SAM-dependent RNA methyltransferase [Roseitranquillus sediminis]MBM9595704.1 RsmB/NOP family class I SAM-dependent RNA methyltransferase [Roseitranquillus sediminis]